MQFNHKYIQAFCLLFSSAFVLTSCGQGTNDFSPGSLSSQEVKLHFHDWTDNRIVPASFTVKAAADSLKIDPVEASSVNDVRVEPATAPEPTQNRKIITNNLLENKMLDKETLMNANQLSINQRPRDFGVISAYPMLFDNNTANDPTDDTLYFTAYNPDNESGSNLFAMKADATVIWEKRLPGNFKGNSPTRSGKVINGKNIFYVVSGNGNVYCLDTNGVLISSVSLGDQFANTSVWVDDSQAGFDYVYVGSQNGNFYRLKMEIISSQTRKFTQDYVTKVAETHFSSSPVLNNAAIYLGGENGILYELVPNSGQASRTWDLSKYKNNGSAQIRGVPVFSGNVIIVPAGGYLFRIINSSVIQSPLLELKRGLNSQNKSFGVVFNDSDDVPSGAITSSPFIDPGTNHVYLSNGNAVFELNFASGSSFTGSAKYNLTVAGRRSLADASLAPVGNNSFALSRVGGAGAARLAMVDMNFHSSGNANLNFFTIPFNTGADSLSSYLPLNTFNSRGYAVSGNDARIIDDGNGNVYFTLDDGTVNIITTQ